MKHITRRLTRLEVEGRFVVFEATGKLLSGPECEALYVRERAFNGRIPATIKVTIEWEPDKKGGE